MSTRKVGKLFINGSWVEPNQGKTLEAVNPATEEVIQLFANATKEDVDAAVAAAEAAFPAWSSKTGAERATYLLKIVAEIEKVKDELATTETLDNGKSLRESAADVSDTMSTFNYYAELAKQLDAKQGTKIDVGDNNFDVRVRYEAAGVAGLIIPFNYPLLMAAWKVAPALAAGCTVVLKPSEMTSLSALELANCIHRAGVPAGVFNLITGTGRDAGEPLSNHPSVAKIAFTGSCATGTRVMTTAAQTMKKVTLELGGKSPIIVFPDCDLEKTLEWVAFGIFVNQGQVCSATSRLIIHESIADRFLQQMKEKSQLIKMGNGLEEGVELGPIVSKVQYERVKSYISKGVEEGATLLCGGLPQNINKGYFVLPTVFTNVKPNMTIWREEVFGPVLAVMTFRDEDQAIKLANETEFGLGAAVMSGDEQRCDRVARALRAGIVWINSSQPTFIQAPWGGMKRSGIGRELGTWGLDNYLEVKQVTKNVGGDKLGWYSRL